MTDAAPPLTKTSDGTLYRRMPEVEDEIVRLASRPFDELLERGRSAKSHPNFIRPETLMHFLRRARSDVGDQRYNALFRLLLGRLILALPKAERLAGDGTTRVDGAASDLQDRVRARFLDLLALDRAGGDRMDFYEVHFDEAVAKLRMKAAKGIGARTRRTDPLEADPVSGELPAHVERAAGSFAEPDDAFLFDPIFRKRLLPEIDRLKPEQKEVVTMLLANMQTHSNDPEVPTISRVLGCDAKTVRNRRWDAIAALRAALGLGDDL